MAVLRLVAHAVANAADVAGAGICFRQSSGIPNVWNLWIIYPAIVWVFLTVAGGLTVYLRKPISESEIKRELDRQAGQR
jgi:hypothetical protein